VSVVVTFSEKELDLIEKYGRLRNQANETVGTFDNKTKGFDGESIHMLGVAGELAVHLVTGIEWTGMYIPPEHLEEWLSEPRPDLGEDIEVRTRSEPWHELLVHKNDPLLWRYVLARRVAYGRIEVVGWEFGNVVKQQSYWRGNLPYPAYAYPNNLLKPIGELK